jgi:NitT/TauT family transport system substrate-binding protein
MLKTSKSFVAVVLAIALWIVACSPQTLPPATSTPLTVITGVWPGFAGDYVALEKGFYTDEGVEVKETTIPELSAAVTAFLSGQGEVFWSTTADAIQMSAEDPSVRVFFLVDYSNGGDGILGRNINSPEDLKGKAVAREDILFSHILLRAYLQSLGLTEADIVPQNITMDAAAAAFTAKQVDVAVTTAPWLVTAAAQSDGKIIFSTKDTNLVADVLITRQSVLDTRKAELQAYLRAVDRAVKLVDAGDADALKIVADKLGVELDDVQDQLALVKLFDLEGNKNIGFNPNNPNNLLKNLEFTAQVAYDFKAIANLPDVNAIHDDSIVNSL